MSYSFDECEIITNLMDDGPSYLESMCESLQNINDREIKDRMIKYILGPQIQIRRVNYARLL